MKRFLAIMLCLVMLFSLAPVSAFAADPESEPEEPAAEEVVETADAAEEEQPAEEPAEEEETFNVEEAYNTYIALSDEEKEAFLATLTEEQLGELMAYIANLTPAEETPAEEPAAEETAATEEPTAAEEVVSEQEELELTANLEGSVASVKIGDATANEYDSLDLAISAVINAADKAEVVFTLLSDCSYTNDTTKNRIEFRSSSSDTTVHYITFDLNGKTLTCSASSGAFIINNGSTLEIKNGTISYTSTASTVNAVAANKNSTITISSGTFTGVTKILNSSTFGTVNITGGTFSCDPVDYYDDKVFSASNDTTNNTWTVTEQENVKVTFNGNDYYRGSLERAVTKALEAGTTAVTITLLNGCTADSRIALRNDSSDTSSRKITIDLNGQTLTCGANNGAFLVAKNSTLTIINSATDSGKIYYSNTGDTVSIVAANSGSYVYINGGTFENVDLILNSTTTGSVSITGGTFNIDPSSYVDTTVCVIDSTTVSGQYSVNKRSGVASVKDPDGNITDSYSTLEAAYDYINKTIQNSSKLSTVTLLANVTPTALLKNEYPVKLNLNGYTINCSSNGDTRIFYAKANFRITDDSVSGNGCVISSSSNIYIAYVYKEKTLTIYGGNFQSGKSNYFSKGTNASVVFNQPGSSWFKTELEDDYCSVKFDNAPNSDYPYTYANSATIAYNLNYDTEDETLLATLPDSQTDCAYIDATGGTYVVTNNLSSKQPVKAGAKFAGWNTVQTPTDGTPGTSFKSGDAINIADVSSSVASGTLTLYAQWDTTTTNVAQIGDDTSKQYKTIMEALYNVTDNTETTIKLINNVTDETVTVASTKKVTLNLNGHYLDTTKGELKGSAISNYGELTITDSGSGGYIKGEAKTSGGGIDNSGTLKIIGGTIKGIAPSYGGAIYNSASLTITGGEITGGTAKLGGGIYNKASGSTIEVGGTAVISGNTKTGGTTANNIYLPDGKFISISTKTPLASGANIGITTKTAPIASAVKLTESGTIDDLRYFSSDNGLYTVAFNSTDNYLELKLSTELPDAVKDSTYAASLTLNDSIDINFKVYNVGTDFDKSKLTVTVDGIAIAIDDIYYDSGTKFASCVLASIAPHDMSRSIHVTAAYDGVQFKVFNYSVRTYCDSIFKTYKDETTKPAVYNLCEAVLNYGKYAEDYYNNNDESELNSDHTVSFPDYTDACKYSYTKDADVIDNAVASLSLNSQTTLVFKLKFKGTAPESSAIVVKNSNNETPANLNIVALDPSSGYDYKITISKLGASDLSKKYTVTINGSTFSLSYGVYSYCYQINGSTDESYNARLKNLCKALYNYGKAADAYVAST